MIDEIIKKYTPLGYSFLTEIDNSIACGKYELEDLESGDKVIADITRGNIAENLKSVEALNRKICKERIKDQIKEKIPELPLDDTVLEDIMKQIYDKK